MTLPPYMASESRFYLSEMIDRATMGPTEPALQDSRRSSGMSPSSASAEIIDPISGLPMVLGTCIREAYFRAAKTPSSDKGTPKGQRVMGAGNLLGNEWIVKRAKEAGVWAGDELSFYNAELKVSGRVDLFSRLSNGEIGGAEIKSFGGFKTVPFIKAGEMGYPYQEIRLKDLPQTMTYMFHWNPLGVRYWSLLYITRDGEFNEFVLEWANVKPGDKVHDEAYVRAHSSERTYDIPFVTWGAVRKRYAMLLDHLNRRVMPPRDYNLVYSNTQLKALAETAGGNQLSQITKTDAKVILKNHEVEKNRTGSDDVETHKQYLDKGDFACAYCSWRALCWTNLSPAGTDTVGIAEKPEDVRNIPRPPVVERIVKPELNF